MFEYCVRCIAYVYVRYVNISPLLLCFAIFIYVILRIFIISLIDQYISIIL